MAYSIQLTCQRVGDLRGYPAGKEATHLKCLVAPAAMVDGMPPSILWQLFTPWELHAAGVTTQPADIGGGEFVGAYRVEEGRLVKDVT